jgi:hypothetical protein
MDFWQKIWDSFSKNYTLIMLAINLGLLIALIVRWRIRRKREFIYEVSAKDQRYANLDARLANPEYLERTDVGSMKRYPYKTEYLSSAMAFRSFNGMYIGLFVETEMMKQRFFTDVAEPIEIGSGKECAVTIRDDRIAPHQCLLYLQDGLLCTKNLDTDHTVLLERGALYQRVTEKALVVEDRDTILTGTSRITITFGK